MVSQRRRAPRTASRVRQGQIVQAALGLIGRSGLSGLTIAAIAAEIGVVPSAIYRHFTGKSEILDAILDFIGGRLVDNADAVCADTDLAEERLRLLHLKHIRLIHENRGIVRFVFSEDVHCGAPDRKRRLYEVIDMYRLRVAEIARQGQRLGTLRRDVAPEAVSLMFLGLIQPAAILWHISDGAFDIIAESERGWRLFSRAIRPPGRDVPDTSETAWNTLA